MPKFSNGKITSTAVLYSRGVPPEHSRSFARIAMLNFSTLKSIYRHRNNATFLRTSKN